MLLGEGRGFEIAQGRLGPGRIHHCMRQIGVAERALELMCKRSLNRVAFGKRLAENDITLERIAQSRIEIDQARLLVLHAAYMMDTVGNKAAKQAIAEIKVAVPNMTLRVLDRAMQMHGGGGVSQEFPLAFWWAHSRTLRFADGPDEVHRRQIGRLELRKHSSRRRPMPKMTGGEALAKQLQREGVRVVFGLPGVQLYGAMAALREEKDIRFILTRHEQATTYMADGYARAGGGVGVALVVPGPGVLNAGAGLSTAYSCSSPVFLVAGPGAQALPRQGRRRAARDQRAARRGQAGHQVAQARAGGLGRSRPPYRRRSASSRPAARGRSTSRSRPTRWRKKARPSCCPR